MPQQWSHALSNELQVSRICKYSTGFRTPAVDQSYWSICYNR